MQVLLVSSTRGEIELVIQRLSKDWISHEDGQFTWGQLNVHCLLTGVGSVPTAMHLANAFARSKPDIAIQAGFAGSFIEDLPVGTVVHVIEEQFADLGAEGRDGGFIDIFQLELTERSAFPFTDGKLINTEAGKFTFLQPVKGISVNKVHGYVPSITSIRKRYGPDIESMEGAAFFYTCLYFNVPFIEIRAISNRVEPRDRESWNIDLAREKLSVAILEMLRLLQS